MQREDCSSFEKTHFSFKTSIVPAYCVFEWGPTMATIPEVCVRKSSHKQNTNKQTGKCDRFKTGNRTIDNGLQVIAVLGDEPGYNGSTKTQREHASFVVKRTHDTVIDAAGCLRKFKTLQRLAKCHC
jgi:hypothetical protein